MRAGYTHSSTGGPATGALKSSRKRMAGTILAAAALASGGCGSQALQTSTPPKSVSTASHTKFFNCAGKAQVAPQEIVLSCADAGDILYTGGWTHWGNQKTAAGGYLKSNTCTPDCAAGHYKKRSIVVQLSGLKLSGSSATYSILKLWKIPGRSKETPFVAYALTLNGPAYSTRKFKHSYLGPVGA